MAAADMAAITTTPQPTTQRSAVANISSSEREEAHCRGGEEESKVTFLFFFFSVSFILFFFFFPRHILHRDTHLLPSDCFEQCPGVCGGCLLPFFHGRAASFSRLGPSPAQSSAFPRSSQPSASVPSCARQRVRGGKRPPDDRPPRAPHRLFPVKLARSCTHALHSVPRLSFSLFLPPLSLRLSVSRLRRSPSHSISSLAAAAPALWPAVHCPQPSSPPSFLSPPRHSPPATRRHVLCRRRAAAAAVARLRQPLAGGKARPARHACRGPAHGAQPAPAAPAQPHPLVGAAAVRLRRRTAVAAMDDL